MASAIGPGDWVEKFRDLEIGPPGGLRVPVGFVGRVVRVGILSKGPYGVFESLELAGVYSLLPHRRGRLALLVTAAYRPVYRPRAELIESLKAPPISAPVRQSEVA